MGYFGSKATSGLCQPIIAMMPPHDTYIETHLGGGAIMRRKPAALHNIGIDRDARALDGFKCDYPVELIHGCAHGKAALTDPLREEVADCGVLQCAAGTAYAQEQLPVDALGPPAMQVAATSGRCPGHDGEC